MAGAETASAAPSERRLLIRRRAAEGALGESAAPTEATAGWGAGGVVEARAERMVARLLLLEVALGIERAAHRAGVAAEAAPTEADAEVAELGVLADEAELDRIERAVAVLGDDDFAYALGRLASSYVSIM